MCRTPISVGYRRTLPLSFLLLFLLSAFFYFFSPFLHPLLLFSPLLPFSLSHYTHTHTHTHTHSLLPPTQLGKTLTSISLTHLVMLTSPSRWSAPYACWMQLFLCCVVWEECRARRLLSTGRCGGTMSRALHSSTNWTDSEPTQTEPFHRCGE